MSYRFDRVAEVPQAGFADDEAAREYGRQLAMDLVLQQLYQQQEETKTRPLPWIRYVVPIAAALVLLGMLQVYLSLDSKKPQSSAWAVQPVGEAEFTVLEPYRIRLEAGEIFVPASAHEVTIETGHGKVSAVGAAFYVDTDLAVADQPFPVEPDLRVTKVRVASGEVTFVTDSGTVLGKADEVLEFEDGKTPKNLGVPE